MKRYLLIDIGNTNIKIMNKVNNKLLILKTNDDIKLSIKTINNLINKYEIKDVYISLVKHKNAILLFDNLKKQNVNVINILDMLKNKNIGTDIQLGSLGVKSTFKMKNFIIIDLGTASTITLVINNDIKGVNIYPGLSTSLEALLKSTSLQFNKDIKTKKNQYIGTTTDEAIKLGSYEGYLRWMTLELQLLASEFKVNNIFITGGDGEKLSDVLENSLLIKDAIFKGFETIINK